jgi:cation diffusion facilitator family transporter
VLVSLKIFLTISTGSLGVLSEALHSSLDLIAAVVTFLSVRVSDRPADEDHPYGHGKIENFSAFVETALLLITAGYIIWEALQRLFFRNVHVRPSLLALVILAGAMAIDITRARALGRVAREFSSDALEADALHFSTDVWSTLAVAYRRNLAALCRSPGGAGCGRGSDLGRRAVGQARARCAARCRPQGFAAAGVACRR